MPKLLGSMYRIYYRIYKFAHDEIPYRFLSGYALPPLVALILLTYRCNLNCKMCYLQERKEKINVQKELTTQEIKNIINQLNKFSFKTPQIEFSGGEPLLRKDILKILKYTANQNKYHILTNGTLLSNKISKELVNMGLNRITGSGLTGITVSIDGPEEIHDEIRNTHGAYKKAIEGIRQIQEHKKSDNKKYPNVGITCCIMPSNVNYLHEIIDIYANIGVSSFNFQVFIPPLIKRLGLDIVDEIEGNPTPTTKLIEEIEPKILETEIEKIKSVAKERHVTFTFSPRFQAHELINYYQNKIFLTEWTCRSSMSIIRINPYGDVYPCFNYKIGNIRDQKISDLWNNKRHRYFRKKLKNNGGIFPECVGCCDMRKKYKIVRNQRGVIK